MGYLKTLVLLVTTFLSGCALIQPEVDYPKNGASHPHYHVIAMSAGGYLMDPIDRNRIKDVLSSEDLRIQNENLEKNIFDEERYIKRILDNFYRIKEDSPNLELTIFIHGGLNTFATAGNLSVKYSQQMIKENQYPVFIGWNSGGPTNYIDHVWKIRRGRFERVIGPLSSPIVVLEDIARSIIRIPAAAYRELINPLTAKRSPQDISVK